jgi:hypothetical protein
MELAVELDATAFVGATGGEGGGGAVVTTTTAVATTVGSATDCART